MEEAVQDSSQVHSKIETQEKDREKKDAKAAQDSPPVPAFKRSQRLKLKKKTGKEKDTKAAQDSPPVPALKRSQRLKLKKKTGKKKDVKQIRLAAKISHLKIISHRLSSPFPNYKSQYDFNRNTSFV